MHGRCPNERAANADETAVDANGTYNGCPAPTNCWISDDGTWFAVST
jgi:hypothetical protein